MCHSIAVLIPCYNEAKTIGKVVDDFKRELPDARIFVYDNASTDETAEIAKSHGATVRFEPRRGKGNVLRQMFRDIMRIVISLWMGTIRTRQMPQRLFVTPFFARMRTWWSETAFQTARMPQRTVGPCMGLVTTWSAR